MVHTTQIWKPKEENDDYVVNAVVFNNKELIKMFPFVHNDKSFIDLQCLIDTGASINTINYRAWVKLGKPNILPSKVGTILLSNNGKVAVEGEVAASIKIGSCVHPIRLVLLNNWIYEIIIGMEFMRAVKAHIDVGNVEHHFSNVLLL